MARIEWLIRAAVTGDAHCATLNTLEVAVCFLRRAALLLKRKTLLIGRIDGAERGERYLNGSLFG